MIAGYIHVESAWTPTWVWRTHQLEVDHIRNAVVAYVSQTTSKSHKTYYGKINLVNGVYRGSANIHGAGKLVKVVWWKV